VRRTAGGLGARASSRSDDFGACMVCRIFRSSAWAQRRRRACLSADDGDRFVVAQLGGDRPGIHSRALLRAPGTYAFVPGVANSTASPGHLGRA